MDQTQMLCRGWAAWQQQDAQIADIFCSLTTECQQIWKWNAFQVIENKEVCYFLAMPTQFVKRSAILYIS
jgi:hypothetical protein